MLNNYADAEKRYLEIEQWLETTLDEEYRQQLLDK